MCVLHARGLGAFECGMDLGRHDPLVISYSNLHLFQSDEGWVFLRFRTLLIKAAALDADPLQNICDRPGHLHDPLAILWLLVTFDRLLFLVGDVLRRCLLFCQHIFQFRVLGYQRALELLVPRLLRVSPCSQLLDIIG